uniref:Ribosome biogenesis protein slx9-like n=1 Tax=Stomoxys calcitrans TaxID=35570 RepID=A0A1I8PCY5_STOCA
MGKVNKKAKIKSDSKIKFNNSKIEKKLQLDNEKSTTIKSKKEKYIQKRSKLVNKVGLYKQLQKEEANRRKAFSLVGDLKPLKDALPSLDEIIKLSKEDKDHLKTGIQEFDNGAKGQKCSSKRKLKLRREQFVRQVTSYQKVLNDPDFIKNPRDIISYHIKYTHGLLEK